ncbi:SAM-dependent methyltransferase [Kitasatospora sp. NPDC096147]|uniref:SAM-dependent methyltransferase n=1 Tax=Kitasatospora sp. NPDC096147 TaxID=3364093 RepID=UPI00380476C4
MADDIEWMKRGLEGPAIERVDLRIDIPHSARMYDFWLGGKTNFPPDRALGDAFEQAIPSIKVMARENRKFLGRAVRYLAGEAGIRQFLDIGTGIPTEGNTHEVAQATAPDSRVVYVDNDPIVLAHARALMDSTGSGRTAYIHADLLEPEKILADPVLADTLDLDQPVGLTLIAVLMLLADSEDPWGKARVLMDALAPGSYVAITHPGSDFDPAAMASVVQAAARGQMTLVPRTREQVARFFGDWELIEPGVVPVMGWRPEDGAPDDPAAAYYWSGIARKR